MGTRVNSRLTARLVVLALTLAFFAVALVTSAPSVKASSVFSWTTETPMGARAAQAVVVGATNGTVYVMGGVSTIGYTPVASAYSYDPATGGWRSLAPMLYATRGAAGAMGLDGRVYVFGGTSGTYTQIYNPDTNAWSLGAAMLQGAWEAKAATVTNGTIWVVGGEGPSNGYAQLYNPTGDSWSVGRPAPAGIECGAMVAVGDDLYWSGGDEGSYVATTDFFMYDASAGSWSTLQDMPSAVTAHAMVVGVDGLLYVVGGSAGSGNTGSAYSSTLVYDPVAGEWSTAADLNVARKYLGATMTPEGRVIALGGNDASTVMNDVESLQLYTFQYSIELSASSVRAGETVLLKLDAQFTNITEVYSVLTYYLESVTDGTVYNPDSVMIPTDAPVAIAISVPTLTPPGDYRVVVSSWTIYASGVYEVVEDQQLPLQVVAAPDPTDALIADLQAQADALKAQLSSSDVNITVLQNQLNAITAALVAMGGAQTAAGAQLNATLADLQQQLDAFQEQINRVEDKADTGGTYGMVTMILVIIIIVLVALMLVMGRRKMPAPPAP